MNIRMNAHPLVLEKYRTSFPENTIIAAGALFLRKFRTFEKSSHIFPPNHRNMGSYKTP